MTNQLLKIVKFISIFSIFIVMAIIYEINFNETNNPKELKLFFAGNTESICQLNKETELRCFQKNIGNIFSNATPVMTYHIINTNTEVYNRANRINGESEANISQYVKNWNIILDNLNSFYLSTDKYHFFQITILPLIKYNIQRELKKSQLKVEDSSKSSTYSTETKNEINKFLKYKISITEAKK